MQQLRVIDIGSYVTGSLLVQQAARTSAKEAET